MDIDINTKFVTLIGEPLSQSFAARMQNSAYEYAGINMKYFYTEMDYTHLPEVINGLRYMNFAGFAITKPNKVEVIKYLDKLEPMCKKIGACNTVVIDSQKRLLGYNTDAIGFYKSMVIDANLKIEDHSYYVLGAGGVSRAICFVLAQYGAKTIYVSDRYRDYSLNLVNDINKQFGNGTAIFASGVDYSSADKVDVIINATGIGMGNTQGQSPIPASYLNSSHFLFDACYNPLKTQFLLDGEAKGCKIMNGLMMSLYQGAAQIELWSGQKAPLEHMYQELMNIIEAK